MNSNTMNHYMNQEYNIYTNRDTPILDQQQPQFYHEIPSQKSLHSNPYHSNRPPPPPPPALPVHFEQHRMPGGGEPFQQQEKVYSFVPLDVVTQKKRPRKKYNEVERLYQCTYQNCTKAYGTLNHLNAHVSMQGHGPKRLPIEFKELRRQLKAARAKHHQSTKNTRGSLEPSMQPFATYPNASLMPPPMTLPSNHIQQEHAYPTNTYPPPYPMMSIPPPLPPSYP